MIIETTESSKGHNKGEEKEGQTRKKKGRDTDFRHYGEARNKTSPRSGLREKKRGDLGLTRVFQCTKKI